MRILFVAPRFHTNQFQMVKTLQENNHDVFFHVASHGATEDHSLLTPIKYDQSRLSLLIEKLIGKGGVNRPNYFPNPIRYWKVFKKLKPHVVIIRDPYKFFSLMAAFFSLFTKAKIIFYTQEELFRFRSRKTKLKHTLTLRFFKAAWMTPKLGDAGQYKQLRYTYYIPLPIATKPIAATGKEITGAEPKILMIGKYHQERKKHLLFINAINQLKNKYKFKVTIVGECIREQQLKKFSVIQERVHSLGLADMVELKKNVPFDQMEALYTSHDVFVLPAVSEQYGVSVTEALGYGLPAICTDSCGARYNIRHGENGFVVKSNSLEELIVALDALIGNKKRLCEMSQKSLAYVEQNLSGHAFYERFLHLINDRFQLQENTA